MRVVLALCASSALAFAPSAAVSPRGGARGPLAPRGAPQESMDLDLGEMFDLFDEAAAAAGDGGGAGAPPEPAPPGRVVIVPDADAVGAAVLAQLDAAAEAAIAARGHFALAIPGGSVLKMLAGSSPAWAAKTTLAYVNHKCVDMGDGELATHAKAEKLFLSEWDGVNALVLSGGADAPAEAKRYAEALDALGPEVLPRDGAGLPVFDMMLIGVGDDGHVGSLYPGRDEVSARADAPAGWVLPVEMKTPGSITLALPVMAAAKQVVIAACGVSEKYPQGKSDAMRRAIQGEGETLQTFPAVGLRAVATWYLDEAAGSKLDDAYRK